MSSMNFDEITDFESMERYINADKKNPFNSLLDLELQGQVNHDLSQHNISSNGVVNCFEDEILQELSRGFIENQLFFIKKSSKYRYYSLDTLMQSFFYTIYDNYDPHQNVQVGNVNLEGDIWVKRFKLDSIVPNLWREDWKRLKKQFSSEEMNILFENSDILIFTLKLKCERIVYDKDTDEMSYYENGYWIDPNRPFDILPFSNPYRYHYHILGYSLLNEILGSEVMTKLNLQYKMVLLEMKKKMQQGDERLDREKLASDTLQFELCKIAERMGELGCKLTLQNRTQ